MRVITEANLVGWVSDLDQPVDVWFLPGFGDSHLAFKGGFTSQLAQVARCICFDFPGFGASPPNKNEQDISGIAEQWHRLIENISRDKPVVLVGHSVASIIAVEIAKRLSNPPKRLISVEGNLVKEDAYFSGKTADFADPLEFYRWHVVQMKNLMAAGKVPDTYLASLAMADPESLWRLGHSALAFTLPGESLLASPCPITYFWARESMTDAGKKFLARQTIHQIQMDGAGHWPMLTHPDKFYGRLAKLLP